VTGVENRDWEDLDSFTHEGKPYLLIADTGDNEAKHTRSRLLVVEEPEPGATARASVAWTVSFVYPDGPRDCEAAAVDPSGGRVLLLTKRDTPPRIYSVPLRAEADDAVARAELGGTLDSLATATQGRRMPWALLPDRPTAWDIAPDRIAVLTYGRVLAFTRMPGESLAASLAREPAALALSGGFKGEALALAGNGSLYVTGEGAHAPILASTCACDGCRLP
jgi:hypothetical protein